MLKNKRFVLYEALAKDGTPCSIKISGPRYSKITNPDQINNDQKINSKISSPSVLKQHKLIKSRANYVIVCDAISGVSIKEYIENQTKTINLKRIIKNLELAINLCKALINLHSKGYLHLNFSSSNILRLPNNSVQIIDLQHCSPIRRLSSAQNNLNLQNISLSHMSPELSEVIGGTPDQKSDYYSLGILLYALFTGSLPFSGYNKREWYHNHIAKVPVAPNLKNKHLPHEVSNIIEKLLSKDTQKRYQSGIGILKDLEKCYSELSDNKKIDYFIPGTFDTNEAFSISNKLYGRTNEISILKNCIFERNSTSKVVFIGGRKGSGKSTLISTIAPDILKANGLLCKSSFLLSSEKQPYSGIFDAVRGIIRQVQSEDEGKINALKITLNDLLGENINVLNERIPELKFLLPEDYRTPPLLGIEESSIRLTDSIVRFFQALAIHYNPLVLVFEYINLVDKDSLRLLQVLSETEFNFSVIGLYTTNDLKIPEEIDLIQKSMTVGNSHLESIILKPLSSTDIFQLISDSFNLDNQNAHDLTDIVSLKTNSNSFFIKSFLETLYREKILYFNAHEGKWKVNLLRAQEQQITINLLDVQKSRFELLPETVQLLLQHAAVIGSEFNIETLQKIVGIDSAKTFQMLDTAKENRLIDTITSTPSGSRISVFQKTKYKFSHIGIHQEIYHSISKDILNDIHYKLGVRFLSEINNNKFNYTLADIVKHLNICSEILSTPEKEKLVRLNLKAGKEAMQHGGFEYALEILEKGYKLLTNTIWQEDFELAFDYHAKLIEIHAVCCNYKQMDEINKLVVQQNITNVQRAQLYEIEISACFAQHRIDQAVEKGLEALKILNQNIPKNASKLQIIYNIIRYRNIKIPTQKLKPEDIPQDYLAAKRIISKILSASFYVNKNLLPLFVIRLLVLSQKAGISQYTPVATVTLGFMWQSMGFYKKGKRYGQLGMNLFDKLESEEQWAKAACIYHSGSMWHLPMHETIDGFIQGAMSGIKTGEIEFTSASMAASLTYSFYAGVPLNKIKKRIDKYMPTLDRYNVKVPKRQTKILQQTIEFVQLNTNVPHKLIGKFFNETEVIEHLHEIKDNTSLNHLYINKLILAYLFNFNKEAEEYAEVCRKTVFEAKGIYNGVVFYFYETLLLIRLNETGWNIANPGIKRRIKNNIKLIRKWSKNNPYNFSHKYYLLKAELERIKENHSKCGELYYKAIKLSEQHQFINDVAISNELAAQYWLKRRRLDFAKMYFKKAVETYRIWGSNLKSELVMDQLEKIPSHDEFITSFQADYNPVESKNKIDVQTVLELTNTFSSEINYSRLVEKSLTAILEHAGAQYGMLLLYNDDGQLKPIAKGSVSYNRINVSLNNNSKDAEYPESVINFVKNSKEKLVLNNTEQKNHITNDKYIQTNSIKSLMAVPIIHHSKISGVLYLENNLANNVFNKSRTELIATLCTQLAISIENATMFNTLEEKIQERTKELSDKSLLLQSQNTEIEYAHQELKVLNATKDKFISIIGHDLRGPVGGVNNLLGLLLTEIEEGNYKNLSTYAKQANKTLNETYKLLNDLLLWAKSQRDDIKYKPSNQSLKPIVATNLDLLDHRIHLKNVLVINNIPEDFNAFFDSHQIDIVIRNLIDNALKYVNSKGQITIESRISNNKAVISVVDTGIGIPSETAKRLFYLSEKETSRPGTEGEKGSGLGLVLCKEFVEKNQGEIWVESTQEKGTAFHFSLPLEAPNS